MGATTGAIARIAGTAIGRRPGIRAADITAITGGPTGVTAEAMAVTWDTPPEGATTEAVIVAIAVTAAAIAAGGFTLALASSGS